MMSNAQIPFLDMKLKKAYAEIASDIRGGTKESRNDYLIKPVIPEAIIAMIKRHYEKKGQMIERDNVATLSSRSRTTAP